jgi:heme-degrading monooxygenase HmoA
MFAVIFEVQPKRERWDDYLSLAKRLKPKLQAIEGFIDNERFRSRRDERCLLWPNPSDSLHPAGPPSTH